MLSRITRTITRAMVAFISVLTAGGPAPVRTAEFEREVDWAVGSFDAPVITTSELLAELMAGETAGVLLVDTRTADEYVVSHLPGAVSWNPYIQRELPANVSAFAREGGHLVFYCSIGYRSGYAAQRAAELLEQGGADTGALCNLRGGIFLWANEGGLLEGGSQVHPYNAKWGRLLRDDLRAPLEGGSR